MTPTQKLEALIEAREKATDGVWAHAGNRHGSDWVQTNGRCHTGQTYNGSYWDIARMGLNGKTAEDADFIAQAANFAATDAKAVLERLRRLEGALRYYADEDTWDKICIDLDYGRDIRRISLTGKARAALAEGE